MYNDLYIGGEIKIYTLPNANGTFNVLLAYNILLEKHTYHLLNETLQVQSRKIKDRMEYIQDI